MRTLDFARIEFKTRCRVVALLDAKYMDLWDRRARVDIAWRRWSGIPAR
jgi:hypothetical protein